MLTYNALLYYEEAFYRQSVAKLQEKLRATNKSDEKLRDQLLQAVERDNHATIEIVRHVRRDFLALLDPYCKQYQVQTANVTSICAHFKY
jgi:hypothetical protein